MAGIQDLARLLIPNRTPPGGVVRSVGAMPVVSPASVMAQTAPAAAPLTPTAKYIQDMQALMTGGIGPLSTGQKISAVGQVLQAAGSRGAMDPSAVIQNVRKQQMEKLNAQYQIAQLQQSQQQEAAQRAAIAKYKVALEPDEINALEGLPLEEQAKKVAEIAFRQKQVFNRDRDPDTGNLRLTYGDGEIVVTDKKMPVKTREIDVGNAVEIYDEDTNELVMSVPKRMSAFQSASLVRQDRREARIARGGGGGGGSGGKLNKPEPVIVDGVEQLRQWDPKRNMYVPFTQPGVTKRSKAPTIVEAFGRVLPKATGVPLIRQ
tara:strand:+ start:767 stop:1723 length:957 start_codon:yes stop_codon:yes gene_type:complete